MTWTLLHERMAFMAQLIQVAETDSEGALPWAGTTPEVSRLFGDEEGLLLSLAQRWITTLVAKLDQAAHECESAEQVTADFAAAEPGLHALVEIGSRRSLRVRALCRGSHVAVDLFGGPAGDRQTVA
jgi:ATP adenylyltransferase